MNGILKLGEHVVYDLSGCDRALLFDSDRAKALFSEAVKEAGLTIVDEGYHKFSPHGFTCFLLLAESHASLHTWPEFGYCAIDLFTCNLGFDVTPLLNLLKDLFAADHCSVRTVNRQAVLQQELCLS